MRLRRIFIIVLFALLAVTGPAAAELYLSSGPHFFRVQAMNGSFKDIQNARGRVFVSGNSARIDVEADGYRSGYEYVMLQPNVTSYYVRVRLEEPMVSMNLVDNDLKPIANSSFSHYSQNMYWADEFGFTGQFPKSGFEKLTARNFSVRINHLYAFAPRVYLTSNGDYWRFEIVVKRRDMNSMFINRFEIMIERDPVVAPPATAELIALAGDYSHNLELAAAARSEDETLLLQSRLESNAAQIIANFASLSADDQNEVMAQLTRESPLTRTLKGIAAFENLHR
ncbi:MAG TPA: hypothetical protein PKN29_13790 [Candidatus Ozemobacteraceae bacterium]|nr:hypothetical protein [Candidatus Ozemobacteraceae bacterium]